MLTVICGSMFSEKSTELQRRGKRLERAGKNVVYFKPDFDDRYSKDEIVTHNGERVNAFNIPTSNHSHLLGIDFSGVDAILIDEVQFLSTDIQFDVAQLLRRNPKIQIIAAGLDLDFTGSPFLTTAFLMAMAEEVVKLTAVCDGCGADAWVSARKTDSAERHLLGSSDIYHPLCRKCFNNKTKGGN